MPPNNILPILLIHLPTHKLIPKPVHFTHLLSPFPSGLLPQMMIKNIHTNFTAFQMLIQNSFPYIQRIPYFFRICRLVHTYRKFFFKAWDFGRVS